MVPKVTITLEVKKGFKLVSTSILGCKVKNNKLVTCLAAIWDYHQMAKP